MNAFTEAADVLFLDEQRKKIAVYRDLGTGPERNVVALFSRPMRDMVFGLSEIVARDLVVRVRLSEVAAPARGDTIEIDKVLYKVEKAQPDGIDVWSVLTLAYAESPVA